MSSENKGGVRQSKSGDVVTVGFIDGRIDDETQIRTIGTKLELAIDSVSSGKLLLNFDGVNFMSSAMIGQLIMANKSCEKSEIELKLCNLAPDLTKALKATRLDKVLDIYDNEEKAIKSFKKKWDTRKLVTSIIAVILGSLFVIGVSSVPSCEVGTIGPVEVTPEMERQDRETLDRIGEQEWEGLKALEDGIQTDSTGDPSSIPPGPSSSTPPGDPSSIPPGPPSSAPPGATPNAN